MTTIYVAINKETGAVMSGAKEQYAFGNTNTLRRSLGQAYGYSAMKEGKKPLDLYDIHEIDLDKVLNAPPVNSEPFVVKEIYNEGNDYSGSSLKIEVNGKSRVNAYPLNECPEDATLERDLGYVHGIEDLMREAYEAGKAGRPYEYISEEESEEE